MYHVFGNRINTWYQFLEDPSDRGIFNIPISQVKNWIQEGWFVLELCWKLRPIWFQNQTSNPLFWVLGPNSIVFVSVCGEDISHIYTKQMGVL